VGEEAPYSPSVSRWPVLIDFAGDLIFWHRCLRFWRGYEQRFLQRSHALQAIGAKPTMPWIFELRNGLGKWKSRTDEDDPNAIRCLDEMELLHLNQGLSEARNLRKS
jgi:hypothetical protein